MARRRRSSTNASSTGERDFTTQTQSLAQLLRPVASPADYTAIEDRRTYHPLEYFRPARTTNGGNAGPVRVTPQKSKSNPFLANTLSFPNENVLICVRRKTRKEVLFAKKKTGRGSSRGRKRKNWYSNIGC